MDVDTWLTTALGDHDFVDFELTKTGILYLPGDRLGLTTILFMLRIGMFMNLPTEAIIAHKRLVKARPWPWRKADVSLKKLKLETAYFCTYYTPNPPVCYRWSPQRGLR